MNDLELINRYSQKPLTVDDVFIFSLTLCDNDVDRDFEAFSDECLEELKPLFVGKTGIFDHSPSAANQTARIFHTEVKGEADRRTVTGEAYKRLFAKAYMVRTKDNESLIREIEGGIKKEVSIGCSVRSRRCSICGKDKCAHKKGKTYGGKLAYEVLGEATDAYEWSFVAVPAQRGAGVSKTFSPETFKTSVSGEEENTIIKSSELSALLRELDEARKTAAFGEKYRAMLIRKLRTGFVSKNGRLSEELMEFASGLDAESLERLAAETECVIGAQLAPPSEGEDMKYYL